MTIIPKSGRTGRRPWGIDESGAMPLAFLNLMFVLAFCVVWAFAGHIMVKRR